MKKEKNDILFLIFARLNSERLKHKMIRPFQDSNLLEVSLGKFLNCDYIPRENIYLAAHEPELLSIGKKNNVNTFIRSYESSVEESDIKILYDWHIPLGKKFKYYVMINPCCPFLKESTIEDFVKKFQNSENDGMFGVIKKRNMVWDENFNTIKTKKNGESINTKTLGFIYEAAHCLYAGKISRIAEGTHMGTFKNPQDPELYIMEDGIEIFDIDYPWQFELAEHIYSGIEDGKINV